VEVISPELALVDPELAERARALLPSYGDLEDLLEEVPVVSPELVLVDPVLAEWARARLPDRPLEEVGEPDVVAPAAEPASAWSPQLLWRAAEERNLEERAVAERKRQRRRRIVLGIARAASFAAAAAVIAAVGFLAGASLSRRGPPVSAVFNASAETASLSSRAQRTTSQRPRTFVWAPATGAVGYEVAFYRSGRRVFFGKTKDAQFSLRRLAPGVYRWYVWPLYRGQRRGNAVVQSRLTVPAR
jgi:hypothetical protein